MGRLLRYFFAGTYDADPDRHQKITRESHQRVSKLGQQVYTKGLMQQEVSQYLGDGDYYEAGVLCLVLSEWPDDKFFVTLITPEPALTK